MRIRKNREISHDKARESYPAPNCIVNRVPWEARSSSNNSFQYQIARVDGSGEARSFDCSDSLLKSDTSTQIVKEPSKNYKTYCCVTNVEGLHCGTEAEVGYPYCQVHKALLRRNPSRTKTGLPPLPRPPAKKPEPKSVHMSWPTWGRKKRGDFDDDDDNNDDKGGRKRKERSISSLLESTTRI